MANIMGYLAWRGDIALAYSPFNDLDSLVLSALSYLNYPQEPTRIRDLGVHVPAVDQTQFPGNVQRTVQMILLSDDYHLISTEYLLCTVNAFIR